MNKFIAIAFLLPLLIGCEKKTYWDSKVVLVDNVTGKKPARPYDRNPTIMYNVVIPVDYLEMDRYLKDEGMDGWELSAAVPKNPDEITLFLKRQFH